MIDYVAWQAEALEALRAQEDRIPKYAIWDKQSDIYTQGPAYKEGKTHWTAQEFIENEMNWAAIPGIKVVVGGGLIQGGYFNEFEERKAFYRSQGATWDKNASDRDILDIFEIWDNRPYEPLESDQSGVMIPLELADKFALMGAISDLSDQNDALKKENTALKDDIADTQAAVIDLYLGIYGG